MHVGVIMGGVSDEREISILTGNEIIDNLDKEKYEVLPVPINTEYELIDRAKSLEFAFIALHGSFGEDGKIQAILESLKVPYSGCGVLESALCMDKNICKKVFLGENIATPKWIMVKHEDDINYEKVDEIGYPVVVKPNSGGSSIGVFIIKNKEDLKGAVKEALKHDKEVMIEEYIKGEEITCCMLDGELLPILSIKPKKDVFFDYKSKYEDEGAEEVVANLPDHINKKVKEICKKCWESLNLRVYARVDIMIKGKDIYVLEVNTLPGMTKNSLFPKSAKAANISFKKLLDTIIELSEKRF